MNATTKYINSNSFNLDDTTENHNEEMCEEWMYLAKLIAPKKEKSDTAVDFAYIDSLHMNYGNQEVVQSMPFLLEQENVDQEKNITNQIEHPNHKDHLNEKQQLAYNVVKFHFETKSFSPLHLIIRGQGGSGKGYVINAIRSLLLGNSIVASHFGIALFNISCVTLHSLLRLLIHGRNTCDLKGEALAQLQEKLKNIKYVIIDEFSVIGLRMLRWIDKCL